MEHKKWLKTFFAAFLSLLAAVTLVNVLGDPMLVLPFVHKLNDRVRFINERQQKTNQLFFLHYYGVKDFDGVILGSSRSSGLDPALLAPQYSVYNYAAAASRPDEAVSYLRFAQEMHGKELKLIVMGLDFMAADAQKSQSRAKGGAPVIYTQDVQKPFFTLANLFNLKAAHLATRNIRANLNPTKENYYERSRYAVVEYFRPGPDEQNAAFNETLGIYRTLYRDFRYSPDYKAVLQEVKAQFPSARFVAFTTPVSLPHLRMIEQEGKTEAYRQWLRDLTDVFGEVWHFMDNNEVTRQYPTYFADSHHLYPGASGLILKRIAGAKDAPATFGKKLTPANIDGYLQDFHF